MNFMINILQPLPMPNRVPLFFPAGTVSTAGLPEGEPGVGSTTARRRITVAVDQDVQLRLVWNRTSE